MEDNYIAADHVNMTEVEKLVVDLNDEDEDDDFDYEDEEEF